MTQLNVTGWLHFNAINSIKVDEGPFKLAWKSFYDAGSSITNRVKRASKGGGGGSGTLPYSYPAKDNDDDCAFSCCMLLNYENNFLAQLLFETFLKVLMSVWENSLLK